MAATVRATAVTARSALLQALVKGPGFGLELIDRVREQTKGQLELSQGSIYPTLRDLEHEGLVATTASEPMASRGGRPRVYYKLTALGATQATQDREMVSGLFGLALVGGSRD